MAFTGKQRRALRALGHHLRPVVQVGQDDVSDGVVGAVVQALLDHELIKVKVGEGSGLDRKAAAALLAEKTGSELIQVLGRTILLYKRHPEKPRIVI
jgi:RNA-binding protein